MEMLVVSRSASLEKKSGPSRRRAAAFAVKLARLFQSFIRSHANGPGPKDVVLVRMVMTAAG
jgi:hypothetical protein